MHLKTFFEHVAQTRGASRYSCLFNADTQPYALAT